MHQSGQDARVRGLLEGSAKGDELIGKTLQHGAEFNGHRRGDLHRDLLDARREQARWSRGLSDGNWKFFFFFVSDKGSKKSISIRLRLGGAVDPEKRVALVVAAAAAAGIGGGGALFDELVLFASTRLGGGGGEGLLVAGNNSG